MHHFFNHILSKEEFTANHGIKFFGIGSENLTIEAFSESSYPQNKDTVFRVYIPGIDLKGNQNSDYYQKDFSITIS